MQPEAAAVEAVEQGDDLFLRTADVQRVDDEQQSRDLLKTIHRAAIPKRL